MPYIGIAITDSPPEKTYKKLLRALEEKGFKVDFSKHHWAGDLPFGLLIAETNRGKVAIRWSLGRGFKFKLEEIDEEAFEEFIDETLDYISGD
ncbi:MAG: hypothetical protein PWQ79_1429 [Thermococcaceae archaeon]|nr:hypothetical protein [Thermococcaceae archaeon]MDK2914514.1 hypothetical protein [Thermococcaceae archaeon]